MIKLILPFSFLILALLNGDLLGQEKPSLIGQGAGKNHSAATVVIYDQMDNPGTNSITSQNFETANDIFDSFAADDFAIMDMRWLIETIDVLGVYYNGSGPASSVNVWIYLADGAGGLPIQIVFSALNIIPSAGLADGSFSITLPVPLVLNEGWYWLCIQANMNSSPGGQWGWTGRTVQSFSESAWKNPGGGFGTICTPSWGYRVTNCAVGTEPDNCFSLNGAIVPVELISFSAIGNNNEVELNWSTATETNNQGFEIERKFQNSQFEKIVYVPGWGSSSEMHYYSYIDKSLTDGKYSYRLKQIDFNGSFEYSKAVEIEITEPYEYVLEQNYPNPFNPSTTIMFALPHRSKVSLGIYDILGELVVELINDQLYEEGYHKVLFDGSLLSSGTFVYRLKAGNYTDNGKMILLR